MTPVQPPLPAMSAGLIPCIHRHPDYRLCRRCQDALTKSAAATARTSPRRRRAAREARTRNSSTPAVVVPAPSTPPPPSPPASAATIAAARQAAAAATARAVQALTAQRRAEADRRTRARQDVVCEAMQALARSEGRTKA